MISTTGKHYHLFVPTIRQVLFLCSVGFLFFLLIILFGCGNRRGNNKQPEMLQQALDKVYGLYIQIGQKELDSVSAALNVLEQYVGTYDSSDVKPIHYGKLMQIRNELSNYLASFNEFHEEIYAVEDNLLLLENSFMTGKLEETVFFERIKSEISLLDNIGARIGKMRQKADSTLAALDKLSIID